MSNFIREQELNLEIRNVRMARNQAIDSLSPDAYDVCFVLGERMERLCRELDSLFTNLDEGQDNAMGLYMA